MSLPPVKIGIVVSHSLPPSASNTSTHLTAFGPHHHTLLDIVHIPNTFYRKLPILINDLRHGCISDVYSRRIILLVIEFGKQNSNRKSM